MSKDLSTFRLLHPAYRDENDATKKYKNNFILSEAIGILTI